MGRSKPDEPLKLPHKTQNNEQNKQTNKRKHNTKRNTTCGKNHHNTNRKRKRNRKKRKSTEKRDRTHEKYVRNQENIPYYKGYRTYRRINRKDSNKQQFDEDGELINSSNEDFEQPSDEDAQGKVITMRQINIARVENTNHTPHKQDSNPAAAEEEAPPSPERQDRP
jgi:hypothetical protein